MVTWHTVLVTVTATVAVKPPAVAEMVAVPADWPMMRPAVLTVATVALLLLHEAVPVTSVVLPSLKWSVAVICVLVPRSTVAVVGETVSDVAVTPLVTVTAVEPEMLP